MKQILLFLSLSVGLLWVAGCGGADKALGEACTADSDCIDGKCHAAMCVSPSPVATGQACTLDAECKSLSCVSDTCSSGTSAKDTACLNNEECKSGLCEGGKCALKKDGAACTAAAECLGGTCYQQKCTSKKDVKAACTGDGECASGICYSSTCRKDCTGKDSCESGQICASDDGKRTFCLTPSYDQKIGSTCAYNGQCTGGLKCLGMAGDAQSVCTTTCQNDLGCPPHMNCDKQADGTSVCVPRGFCSPCLQDSNCPAGHTCAAIFGGSEKYCTTACNLGNSECPMFSQCKAVAGGSYCVHKLGKCVGDGSLCAPCAGTDDCSSGGMCLTLNLSGEKFCGTDCKSSGTCQSGYSCATVSTSLGLKQCVPQAKGSPPYYTCTSGISFPIFEVGDTMYDFAMVGYKDSDGDGQLTDEALSIVRLSDYKGKAKLILFNIMTFW